jgi:uncharacterized membrane protein
MKLETYTRYRSVIVVAIAMLMAVAVIQNSIFIAVAVVTFGGLSLSLVRRRLTEIEHDERSTLIQSKAASSTLAIVTVGMAVIGLSLIFLSGHGIGNFEQIGYVLAFQANIIMALRASLTYYYRNQLGG